MTDNKDLDPKAVVKQGYDQIAEKYLDWVKGVRVVEREQYTNILLDSLPEGSKVLELGCGAGDPTTKKLSEKFKVTGVDISDTQIEMARKHVPNAEFIREDMTKLDFPDGSFDGVTAFYSITHISREQHPALLNNIGKWIRPNGVLVLSMSKGSTEGMTEPWIDDRPMYFSGFDPETNKKLVQDAGLEIVSAREETDLEFGQPTTFLWVVARKSSSA